MNLYETDFRRLRRYRRDQLAYYKNMKRANDAVRALIRNFRAVRDE